MWCYIAHIQDVVILNFVRVSMKLPASTRKYIFHLIYVKDF